jgi:hypothetical protein
MYRTVRAALPWLAFFAAACDGYRGPRLALQTNAARETPAARTASGTTTRSGKGPIVYGGKTAEQWGQALNDKDREEVAEACRALRVMGKEGRPYLIQGLDNSNPETRRLCLESLTIADFKKMGDAGRTRLVKLAGDHDDMRIRERAAQYLRQWHGSIPSP